ncbi:MAG: ABC transporter permease [candidate division Zixibacteria bacterium]|nr:ABC transporter permease [candidate division Zixibacteria bacterium]MDH3938429.1 ABC transporter permease [candidate division Zixibacteria bacterium]MDH4035148.1 ABC transporter permease [candidate division Zixibacteria bacterium]
MLKNYLISAIRTLSKQKLFTAINVFGLTIGLAACLIAMGHLAYEISFEEMHINRDRIYRVDGDYTYRNGDDTHRFKSARVTAPVGPAVALEIPEVEKTAIFRQYTDVAVTIDGEGFRAGNMITAYPELLDVFTLPLKRGNPSTILTEPFTLLITESAAEKLFPLQDPMGRTLTINENTDYRITGVLADIPKNTQLHCDFIASYTSLQSTAVDLDSWEQRPYDYLYLLLSNNADVASVEQKIGALVAKHLPPEIGVEYELGLRPFSDIYLGTLGEGIISEMQPRGEYEIIYMFGILALFILVQAVAGFVNLTTARSADRMKEVGVRKVLGAERNNIVKQFLGESLLLTMLSILVSLVLYEVFKSEVDQIFMRQATVNLSDSPLMLALTGSLVVVVGILAGLYPALYMSRFRPAAILKRQAQARSPRSTLRRILVVTQFAIAITFICCAVITYQQVDYLMGYDLGFKHENMLVLDFEGNDGPQKCRIMKSGLLANRTTNSATASYPPPGRTSFAFWGFYADAECSEVIRTNGYVVDYDFMSTFDLTLAQGRAFSPDHPEDEKRSVLIDESSARFLQMDNPVGQRLYRKGDQTFEIVGVVKDFLGTSKSWARQDLMVIMLDPEQSPTLTIELPAGSVTESLASVAAAWEVVSPGEPFEYRFLDAEIDQEFDEARWIGRIFFSLALVTIIIGCLSVFGLVSYSAEQRTKEIGVRKVLGAHVTSIVALLAKEFVILLAIANAIAWPAAYFFMQDFLSMFASHIDISITTFVIAGGAALLLALATAAYQATRAALANPADSLRSE